ncbi:hypothetical protein OHW01_12170 [Acinetobacter baumannii]|uniref:hypothetical protein n=1 Tax=Acinetobacter baumannii TaxID=470 RepID=UPI00112006F2|nr:hypothetical protein [Acinetobacter baumannii]MDC4261014.1 hypothetical protein [Acinetobacter baumannii]MDC4875165.1 hypothetical protein [Acinetobacter baumannii]MDC4884731.1 hypothetical protein [Acinetobacter baumannii]MDC4926501.1 hypothetical protein [Acinetobacter baumannii]MDC4938792.1 hypothetical protein [Acinetobacter baumannii]
MMIKTIGSIFSFFFSRRGIENFWIQCIYWTFPIILIITLSRFEYSYDITKRIANAKLLEIRGVLVEHRSSKGGGGLYIYGRVISLLDNGTEVKLRLIAVPSSLHDFTKAMNEETVILFGRVLDQSLYPTRITNMQYEEYASPSSKEFRDSFIQSQATAPKEARKWGYISFIWLILIILSRTFKRMSNSDKS